MPIITTSDSYTKLLIHSDGPDNGVVFTDSSPSGHTLTQNGASHQDSNKKFGATSILFDGSGDYILAPQSTDFQFGTGDYTIDLWFNWDAITSNEVTLCYGNGQGAEGWKILFDATNCSFYGGSGIGFLGVAHGLTAGYWFHWAIVRKSMVVTQYKDGIALGSNTHTGSMGASSSLGLTIGAIPGYSQEWDGYMDEIRISKGIARWTSNFTPPEKPYDIINTETQTLDAKEDSAFEVTGGGNAQFGSNIITRSDPSSASTDTVFSVNAKDGDSIIDVREDKTVAYDWDNVVTREGMISNTSARHGVIKASFKKDLNNATATDFFRIECYNHNTGGAGCFSCIIHLMMSSKSSASSSLTGMMSGIYMFGNATRGSSLTAVQSPMQVIEETPQVNSLSASMGSIVLPIAVTINNVSQYRFDIQIDADARYSNNTAGTPQALAYVEVMWRDYAVGPILSQL